MTNHAGIKPASKINWNEIEKVGRPTRELRIQEIGKCKVPRIFLCRGEYSIFTSTMFEDGSGFADEENDPAKAWAVIDGF